MLASLKPLWRLAGKKGCSVGSSLFIMVFAFYWSVAVNYRCSCWYVLSFGRTEKELFGRQSVTSRCKNTCACLFVSKSLVDVGAVLFLITSCFGSDRSSLPVEGRIKGKYV